MIYRFNHNEVIQLTFLIVYNHGEHKATTHQTMFKIVSKRILNPTVTEMEIYAPLVAKKAEPGQFIILRVEEDGETIPLTVAGYKREKGLVKIIFQIVGATTEKLNHKEEGEYISDFVGPLGVPTHVEGLKKVCVIGGGVGCAIALPIAEKLHKKNSKMPQINASS